MAKDLILQCRCGSVRGTFSAKLSPSANRFICLCDDCQTFAHHLGQAEAVLDANGGTEILPIAPASLTITAGQDRVKALRLSPKGLYRWYADCCKTPIGNTPDKASFPYIGLIHSFIRDGVGGASREKSLGKVQGRVMGKSGHGALPKGTAQGMPLSIMATMLRFLLTALLRKLGRPSPFFDDAGKVRVVPSVLTKEERMRAREQAMGNPVR